MPQAAGFVLDGQRLICRGEWSVRQLSGVDKAFKSIVWPTAGSLSFDGSEMTHLDSAAAWFLLYWRDRLHHRGITVQFERFPPAAQQILRLVNQGEKVVKPVPLPKKHPFLARFWTSIVSAYHDIQLYLAFVGRLNSEAIQVILHPGQFRFGMLTRQIDLAGFNALPIIGLLSFMVGVVLAYQLGIQLRNYGANVFIADLLGMSVLREFGPLLTAIMVAGRTGSSFTAELGMMKISQEIDALQTMGISPEALLVLPRITGLFIVLPLLTIWADIFGVFGGMLMAGNMLQVTWYDFLVRLQHQVPLRMLLIGLGKAPVFALIIASISCFQGMQVKSTADSLGKNTTRSVVLSIFFIIVADAAFSVIFSRLRL